MRQILSQLLLGKKGGENRIQIISALRLRPYNLNQLAEALNLNYRTIKHHIDVLVKNDLLTCSKAGGYGEVYFLTPELESNMSLFNEIATKMKDVTSSSQFFQNVIEQTNMAVMIFDQKGDVFFWNQSAENMFGYTEDEVLGKRLPIFPKTAVLDDILKKVSADKGIVLLNVKARSKTGRNIELGTSVDLVKDNTGRIIGYSMLARDISEQMELQRDLRESEERYALAETAAGIGSWDWEITTGGLKWSNNIEPMFGFKPGGFEKTYEGFLKCIHPDDRKFVTDSVNASTKGRKRYSIEHRIVWPNGSVHWVKEQGAVVRDKKGKAVRMLGIVHDITDQKNAEAEVQHMASFPALNPNPILEIDLNKKVRYCNRGTYDLLKRAGAKDVISAIFPQDIEEILNAFRKGKKDVVLREVKVGNVVLEVTITYTPEFDTVRFYGIDVTGEKMTEIQYKDIIEDSPEGFWINDMEGHLTEVNSAYCKMSGYTKDELLKMSIKDIEIQEKPKETEKHIKKILEEGYDIFETKHKRKDGTIFSLEVCANYSNQKGGQLIVFLRDITERLKTEQTLKETEELYQWLFDTSPLGKGLMDLEGNFILTNKAMEGMVGYDRQDLNKKKVIDIFLDPNEGQSWIANHVKDRALSKERFHLKRKDGTTFTGRVNGQCMMYKGKDVIIFNLEDISDTERERIAREKLIDYIGKMREVCEEKSFILSTVIKTFTQPIMIYDAEGKINEANEKAAASLGFDPKGLTAHELLKKLDSKHGSGDRMAVESTTAIRALKGETVNDLNAMFTDAKGQVHSISSYSMPLKREGKIIGAVVTWQENITAKN